MLLPLLVQVVLEGDLVNLDVTSPAATLALGLQYLATDDAAAAEMFAIPGALAHLRAWLARLGLVQCPTPALRSRRLLPCFALQAQSPMTESPLAPPSSML